MKTEKRKVIRKSIKINRETMLPFLLMGLIILADQAVKALIVLNWPREGTFIKDLFGNEVLQFYHVRNRAIAFSLGQNIPDFLRLPLFTILPVLVLAFLLWYYFTSSEFRPIQRWAVAGIIGGGIGNILDRIFRPDGVVDFIIVKFYGLLGMERWPTFNIADASVVVCCLLLLVTILLSPKEQVKTEKELPL
jgi:signal peptidase II